VEETLDKFLFFFVVSPAISPQGFFIDYQPVKLIFGRLTALPMSS
jgi:hypothetical protein